MNDMAHTPEPVFELVPQSEDVPTTLFGTVTVTELPSRRLTALYQAHDPETDSDGFANHLLIESARGEHGERFTVAFIESLPNRALPDLKLLMQAAVRVNGMERSEVEKA